MRDPYFFDDCDVLKNRFNIRNEKELEEAESDISTVRLYNLYKNGYRNFSAEGFCALHRIIFGDVYDWAGEFRSINMSKRESILAGISVWYSNWDTIETDLDAVWKSIHERNWQEMSETEFVSAMVQEFPKLWRVHPFREGNTRTTVALMSFWAEEYGFEFDRDYMANHAEYVRNALVMCCLDDNSEPEYLTSILSVAIHPSTESVPVGKETSISAKEYKPTPHEYIESYDAEDYESRIEEALKTAGMYFHTMEEE